MLRICKWSLIAFVLATAAVAEYEFIRKSVQWHVLFMDYTVFWTAARSAMPYDAVALTEAQQWWLQPEAGLRPFPYPPSSIIFFMPLALWDYWHGLVVWLLAGVAAFAAAARLYGRYGLVALASPMLVMCLITGQVSLLVGAAAAAAVALLPRNQIAAGAFIGLAGIVKPQFMLLAPIALLAAGHWRGIGSAAAVGAVGFLVSLAFGPELWSRWYQSLSGFGDVVLVGDNYMNMAPGVAWAPLGVAAVWCAFRYSELPAIRLAALTAGTCLCVPYMMNYDLVAMAPAVSLMFTGDWRRHWPVGALAFLVFPFSVVVQCIAVLLTLLSYRVWRPKLS